MQLQTQNEQNNIKKLKKKTQKVLNINGVLDLTSLKQKLKIYLIFILFFLFFSEVILYNQAIFKFILLQLNMLNKTDKNDDDPFTIKKKL